MPTQNALWFLKYFEQHEPELLEKFFQLLRFKSISTEAEYQGELVSCVKWLEAELKTLGFKTEVWETSFHPVLFASRLDAGADKPTVLIYNHYDVQPVDPLEMWHSPPFEPEIRGGEVFARGAQDNKGQCFYVLTALKALIERDGKLPVNVKLCIEGEEEAGSKGLAEILRAKSKALQAEYLAVVDMGVNALDQPAVTLGLRGMAHMHLEVIGSHSDLHSGIYGGMAYNPLHALVEMLAKCRDANGRVTIPGFYDDIDVPTADEIRQLDLSFDEKEFVASLGQPPTGGEKDFTPVESNWLRPTLEINGIGGGYFGSGFKTVIPGKAVAKLSIRLVPNQDAAKIAAAVEKFLRSLTPPGVELRVLDLVTTGGAIRNSPNSTAVRASARAYEEVCDNKCGYILTGGSIPIVGALSQASGAEPVMLGYGLSGDNMHAPNEHFGINRLRLGTATMGRLLEILGE